MKFTRIMPMLAFALLSAGSIEANAATYTVTFYEQTGATANLFDSYRVAGSGTFEIADSAVFPDNGVLYTDPEFLSFNIGVNTLYGSESFVLGSDEFTSRQGILFDGVGAPLRFDSPATSVSNTDNICHPVCGTSANTDVLKLIDDNGFQSVYLDDGAITTMAFIDSNPGLNFTRLGGNWRFFDHEVGIDTGGLYEISSVPVPAAVWLFGSGLLGLIEVARRKKVA